MNGTKMGKSRSSLSSINEESLYSVEDEEENDQDTIFETRVSNGLFSQLVQAEYCSLFFATLGLVMSVLIYELKMMIDNQEMNEGNGYQGLALEMALIYNMMCTIFLVFSIYIRYDLWLQWSKTV